MSRNNRTRRMVQTKPGIAYDLLAQELMQRGDFQQLLDQLGHRLRQEVLQQLVWVPLQQLGASLGQSLQQDVFGQSFAPSDLQFGAALRELLDRAERIL